MQRKASNEIVDDALSFNNIFMPAFNRLISKRLAGYYRILLWKEERSQTQLLQHWDSLHQSKLSQDELPTAPKKSSYLTLRGNSSLQQLIFEGRAETIQFPSCSMRCSQIHPLASIRDTAHSCYGIPLPGDWESKWPRSAHHSPQEPWNREGEQQLT